VLAGFDVFTGTGSRMSGAWRIRGAEGIVAKLSRRGIELHLSADRSGIVVTGAGGRALSAYTDAVRAASPLLLPWMRDGVVPTCQVTAHDAEAVTVAAGAPMNIPYCGACRP
jgi:hypothetical protein